METLTLEVETREGTGKGPARRARAQGRMPAVFYGAKSEGQNLTVDARDFGRRIANLEGAHLIELRSSAAQLDKRMVLLREVQHHPVTGLPVHADFYEVALDQAIVVRVPLHFEGKAAGVALGGILHQVDSVRCERSRAGSAASSEGLRLRIDVPPPGRREPSDAAPARAPS